MYMNLEKVAAISGGIQAGDVLTIDSGIRKRCILKRGATEFNIFSAVILPYNWLLISPGSNSISLVDLSVETTLAYQPAYGGL
jgi:hypothetical protein